MAVFACCSAARAVNVDLPRIGGEVVIDGVLDEDAWRDAVQVELAYETHPGDSLPARVKTVAYLMEDGVNLLIGFEASDPDPSAIRAYLRDRDSAYDDDFVGIVIDTYNDKRRGEGSSTKKTIRGTPSGIRRGKSPTKATSLR